MKLDFFQVQELIELEPTIELLDLMDEETLEQCKHVDQRTLKLGFLLAKHHPEATEAIVNETMTAHELKYKSIDLSLEKLTASDFIDLDSKPDWKEFFKLILPEWKDGDYLSYYEGQQHLLNFQNGLKK